MPYQLQNLVLSTIEEVKGEDVVVLDIRQASTFTDYMIIATVQSARQANALREKLLDRLKNERVPILGIEGSQSSWTLIDCGSIVIHLMEPEARAYYNLEGLWDENFAGEVC
jgi:ribosome-associated protein